MGGSPLVLAFETARVDTGPGADLIAAMRDEMAALYEGLVFDGDTMPRAGQRELSAPGGDFIIGRVDGQPVCCGGVKRLDTRTCEIKRMFVGPAYRGRGVARQLLRELESRARDLGYSLARLDTGPAQRAAQHLYESEGYRAIGNFNANPVASFWGEKPL
jgi:GNAT superfamily N-acetyltransferase